MREFETKPTQTFIKVHSSKLIALAIACVAAALYLPYLGAAHLFDWDEINFAECAREMILTKNYTQPQINFQPFYEKPPLFIWFQVLSMKNFGVTEYAARFPDALCGILTLVTVFFVGKNRTNNTRFGVLWAICFGASLLPHLYFKSGIIDPWFNFFIFLSVTFLSKTFDTLNFWNSLGAIFFASLFGGLALLTKGPVALLMIGLTYSIAYLILNLNKSFLRLVTSYLKLFIPFCILAISVASLWFGDDLLNHSGKFTANFIQYNLRLAQTQDAGHGGFIGYHVVVLLLGCFPAVAFALPELISPNRESIFVSEKHFTLLMRVLFYATLIVFSLVQSKIVHYSSLCYFPLTYLAAVHLERILNKQRDGILLSRLEKILPVSVLFLVGSIWCLIIIVLPIVGQHIEMIKPLFSKDPFALANLNAQVEWSYWEVGFGIEFGVMFILGVVLYLNQKIRLGLVIIFSASLFLAQTIIYQFVPKVEKYSQGAAIEFYISHKNLNAVIETTNFKSYAQYFYAEKKPLNYINYNISTLDSLFVSKLDHPRDFSFQKIGQKNGFVFYKKRSH